jgi:hypothetical protein
VKINLDSESKPGSHRRLDRRRELEFRGQFTQLGRNSGIPGTVYSTRYLSQLERQVNCPRNSPACPSWIGAPGSTPFGVSLEQILPGWLTREPDNPYVAALAPLVIADDATLQAQAPTLWHRVERAPLPRAQRDLLAQVLEFWFFERFRGLTAKEIWAMLNLITPIQETMAYQSIFAEGKTEGEAKGKTEGKADTLKRQLTRRFGALPDWARRRIESAPVAQLDLWLDGIFDTASAEDLIGREGEE